MGKGIQMYIYIYKQISIMHVITVTHDISPQIKRAYEEFGEKKRKCERI